jgi:hypothetical protein
MVALRHQDLPVPFGNHADGNLRVLEMHILARRTGGSLPTEDNPPFESGPTLRTKRRGHGIRMNDEG